MSEIWSRHGRPRLALNCVGGKSTVYLSTCLAENGKLVSYGGMSKQPLQIPVGPLIFKNIELHGFWMTKWKLEPKNATKMSQMVDFMVDFVQKGKLVVQEYETVGLEDFAKAIDRSMQGFNKKQIFVF
uniref:Alcohol dehydrogenase-like C-terminal domain-containing protein n=1 Tax=Romanomermis culicivorax TaxID=13658 RepID=A0A915HNB7_ROMCU